MERHGINYNIKLVDNTERNKKYNIIVTRDSDKTDTDYLSISQVTMFYDELQDYLTGNLKIYLSSKNRI